MFVSTEKNLIFGTKGSKTRTNGRGHFECKSQIVEAADATPLTTHQKVVKSVAIIVC